ncbi:DUF805 domain-containing protein [bacterium]|nr:DUF805 domain-containing protein [bacterium]
MTIYRLLFTLHGRLNRKTFILTWFVLMLLLTVSGLVLHLIAHNTILSLMLPVIFYFWPFMVIYSKRMKDRGKRPKYLMLMWIPLVNLIILLWLIIELFFRKGEAGPNKYGPEITSHLNAGPSNPVPYCRQCNTFLFGKSYLTCDTCGGPVVRIEATREINPLHIYIVKASIIILMLKNFIPAKPYQFIGALCVIIIMGYVFSTTHGHIAQLQHFVPLDRRTEISNRCSLMFKRTFSGFLKTILIALIIIGSILLLPLLGGLVDLIIH